MKILMVTMSMGIGGAETHILELCRALKAKGHTVCVASAGGVLVPELEKDGIGHIKAPLHKKDPVSLSLSYSVLANCLQREHYDIVHAHARIPAYLCGQLKKRYAFRFVTTAHFDFRVNSSLRSLSNWGEHTFAVSDDLRDYLLREYGIGSERVTLTVNGIDTDRFSPAPAPEKRAETAPQNEKIILHVSRLEPYSARMAQTLIESAETVCRTNVNICIIGDGRAFPALEKQAQKVNNTLGRVAVRLPGAKTDVRDYVRACDIFVGPSRAALEAMAAEKPTVVGGSEGYLGIFTKDTAKRALATNLCCRGDAPVEKERLTRDLLTLLSTDDSTLSAMGAYNRSFVKECYSTEKMAETHLSVYEKMAHYAISFSSFDAVICGYYGFGNMGDEAVLSALVEGLRAEKPDIRLCILSHTPAETALRHAAYAVDRFDFPKIRSVLRRSALLIFGGGNLLQDETSTASLWYYLHLLKTAERCGTKIAVYSNGIGPVVRPESLDKIAKALSLADSISLREAHSHELVRGLVGEGKNVRLTFDPALLSVCPGEGKIRKRHGLAEQGYFVISPRAIDRYSARKLKKVIADTARETALTPVFIPMQREEDMEVCTALCADIPGSIVITEQVDFASVLDLLHDAAWLLSSRLHTMIYAAAAVCPMLAYSEDIKLRSFLEYIGMEKAAGVSCVADNRISAGEIEEQIETIRQNRTAVCRMLEENLPMWRAMAKHEFSELTALIQPRD